LMCAATSSPGQCLRLSKREGFPSSSSSVTPQGSDKVGGSSRRRDLVLLGSATQLLLGSAGDALAGSKKERGLARYIRRKDTTSIEAYKADILEAKTEVGSVLSELVKADDYEKGQALLREGTFKTFRNSVRAIVTYRSLKSLEEVTLQDVFKPLEKMDGLMKTGVNLKQEEGGDGEAKKAELATTQESIFRAIGDFQDATQKLIEV